MRSQVKIGVLPDVDQSQEEIMQSAIRITIRVLPNGKIEVQLPPESAGDEVEVFVVLPEKASVPPLSAIDIINQSREHQKLFKTSGEVDQYLWAERDSWES
ncbi:MAG: hypothetical protein HC840_11905 [Leptolyngbyaceae cyanobacterium RM2_2_4]|nr:hypothetical protein [Leptolyngbyaceae cyanobacterium SM1_4_3]NJN91906.1 hypothetical protein [Leptolyngbyaceae cyanobacterium SL_5_14]NJO50020.1 hypothetical protein [Leptolyngbyaceae cyanobacterium RM2_2_4]